MDLFELKRIDYLLVVDYFSTFVEVVKLSTTTSSSVISRLKPMFARFSIPAVLVTDNGAQFASKEMVEFSETYGFRHVTTSSYYPQANGLAKRMVRTVKGLLEHSSDPYKSLLSYRATPLPSFGLPQLSC